MAYQLSLLDCTARCRHGLPLPVLIAAHDVVYTPKINGLGLGDVWLVYGNRKGKDIVKHMCGCCMNGDVVDVDCDATTRRPQSCGGLTGAAS